MFDPDKITKTIGIGTAAIAFIGGGYSLSDKIGFFKKPILEWAPEYFSISNGPANSEFHVVVARKKYRDDCSVEDFYLEVRDSVSRRQPHQSRSSAVPQALISTSLLTALRFNPRALLRRGPQRFWRISNTNAQKAKP